MQNACTIINSFPNQHRLTAYSLLAINSLSFSLLLSNFLLSPRAAARLRWIVWRESYINCSSISRHSKDPAHVVVCVGARECSDEWGQCGALETVARASFHTDQKLTVYHLPACSPVSLYCTL